VVGVKRPVKLNAADEINWFSNQVLEECLFPGPNGIPQQSPECWVRGAFVLCQRFWTTIVVESTHEKANSLSVY
jgi:hypothetical protein